MLKIEWGKMAQSVEHWGYLWERALHWEYGEVGRGLVVRDKEVSVDVGSVKGQERDERMEKRIHQREHAERYRCV
jgi:hypothetical protein